MREKKAAQCTTYAFIHLFVCLQLTVAADANAWHLWQAHGKKQSHRLTMCTYLFSLNLNFEMTWFPWRQTREFAFFSALIKSKQNKRNFIDVHNDQDGPKNRIYICINLAMALNALPDFFMNCLRNWFLFSVCSFEFAKEVSICIWFTRTAQIKEKITSKWISIKSKRRFVSSYGFSFFSAAYRFFFYWFFFSSLR